MPAPPGRLVRKDTCLHTSEFIAERSLALRSARTFKVSPRFACVAACVIVGLMAGGCEHTGQLSKGWFAAGEVGRFKKEPLLLPIVSSLDTGIEEPNDEFSQATDVRQEDLMPQATDYV